MFNVDQLAIGAKIEKEHTRDPALALEIAMAHLDEDPAYYAKLERMEASMADAHQGVGGVLAGLVAGVAVVASLIFSWRHATVKRS